MHISRKLFLGIFLGLIAGTPFVSADEMKSEAPVPPVVSAPNPSENLLRDTFYLDQAAKLQREVYDVEGFTLVPQSSPQWNSSFAVVTGFKGNMLTTHILRDVNSVDDARKFFQTNAKPNDVNGVNVRELVLPKAGSEGIKFYWVGSRAFRSLEDAQRSVQFVKKAVEEQGGDFRRAIENVRKVSTEPPLPKPEVPASHGRMEEEYALKAMDWLGFNDYIYGPLYGEPSGERVLYQSTFEASYRDTNLSQRHFASDTGFWSHRVVFRGLRFLSGSTLDPYLEGVPSFQTDSSSFATNLEVSGGIEWRLFARSAILQNYQPYGLPVLDWLRNLRFFVAYSERYNLKNQYDDGVKTHNLRAGGQLFKEWGIDIPSLAQRPGDTPYFKMGDLLWGELFAEYLYNGTNFSSEENYAAIQNTFAFKFGLKLPRVPLPDNPINQEFMVMPYFLFESGYNHEHSFFFQNRYFYGWGVRWMPFRDHRWANNEWLSKTKFFFEYVQDTHYTQGKPESEVPQKDLRLGVNVSFKRF